MAILDKKNEKPTETMKVKATLRVSAAELEKKLAAFPFAKATEGTEKGTEIKYKVCKKGKEKSDMLILECSKDGITLSFYYDEKSKPGKTLNLLRFMSLLAYLKGSYEVVLDELYEQIVESISYAAVIGYKPYIEIDENKTSDLLNSLGKSNLALSNKITELEKSLTGVKEDNVIYKQFSKEVLDRFSLKGDQAMSSADMLGVDTKLRDKIVEMLSKKGD